MLLDGELAQAGRHPEVLGVIAKHGDGAADFLWRNKGTLAGGAALTAFLADPEPFLDGTPSPTGAVELALPSGAVLRFPAGHPGGGDRRRRPGHRGPPVLTVPPTTKLWFAAAVDLRLGFDGLADLVRTQLAADP